jgi:hypothetical protein
MTHDAIDKRLAELSTIISSWPRSYQSLLQDSLVATLPSPREPVLRSKSPSTGGSESPDRKKQEKA